MLDSLDVGARRILAQLRQNRSDVILMIVFAFTAECLRTCYLPQWRLAGSLDMTSVIANISGTFLEGCLLGLERQMALGGGSRELKKLSAGARTSFLSVYTSYVHVIDHAAYLSIAMQFSFWGLTYIVASLLLSFASGLVGFRWVRRQYGSKAARASISSGLEHSQNSLLADRKSIFRVLLAGNVGTLLLTLVIPGLVREPNSPEFVEFYASRYVRVEDSFLELFVGCGFASTAVILAYVLQNSVLRDMSVPNSDGDVQRGGTEKESPESLEFWKALHHDQRITLMMNAASCICLCFAYGIVYRWPTTGKSLVMFKFMSSFCGSFSCLNTFASDSITLFTDSKQKSLKAYALCNILLSFTFFFVYQVQRLS